MKPKIRGALLTALWLYLVVEAASYLSLVVLEKGFDLPDDPNPTALSSDQKSLLRSFLNLKRGRRVSQDPALGWVPLSETNSAGMRDNLEYDRLPPAGVVRIAAFGDSFTYGADVALGDTWAKRLAINPVLQVLNYGVPAYGLDQAYLRYLQVGAQYHPHIVFIGYMSENLARSVNVFRPFYSRSYASAIFTKPRFKLAHGKLVLLANPLSSFADYRRLLLADREVLAELGANDYHYHTNYNRGRLDVLPTVRFAKRCWRSLNRKVLHPIFKLDGTYDVDSEAYRLTVAILDTFHGKVLDDGAWPIILLFPDLNDLRRSRRHQERRYRSLLMDLQSKRYAFIDLLDALSPFESQYSIAALTREWGHYSPLGNRLIANHIARYVERHHLTDPARLREAIHEARHREAPARSSDRRR
jgi:hypothetical protein